MSSSAVITDFNPDATVNIDPCSLIATVFSMRLGVVDGVTVSATLAGEDKRVSIADESGGCDSA
jgi:hypothetical protein